MPRFGQICIMLFIDQNSVQMFDLRFSYLFSACCWLICNIWNYRIILESES